MIVDEGMMMIGDEGMVIMMIISGEGLMKIGDDDDR